MALSREHKYFFEASTECFCDRFYFYGWEVAYPVVLEVLTAVVAEATATDAEGQGVYGFY